MKLAERAFAENNFSRGRELLNLYLPASTFPEADDRRSFYWYYLWRSSHQEWATLSGHQSAVLSVAVTAYQGAILASGSEDKTVKIWDLLRWRELATFSGHEAAILSVALSVDGQMLATGGRDKRRSFGMSARGESWRR